RTQELDRIYLDKIDNVQSSWVTQGPEIGQIALRYGANDFGSVIMEENVVSSAGTTFRLNAEQIESLIHAAGYEPRRRNNWYELLNSTLFRELGGRTPAGTQKLQSCRSPSSSRY